MAWPKVLAAALQSLASSSTSRPASHTHECMYWCQDHCTGLQTTLQQGRVENWLYPIDVLARHCISALTESSSSSSSSSSRREPHR